jgi:hypothetical protein
MHTLVRLISPRNPTAWTCLEVLKLICFVAIIVGKWLGWLGSWRFRMDRKDTVAHISNLPFVSFLWPLDVVTSLVT